MSRKVFPWKRKTSVRGRRQRTASLKSCARGQFLVSHAVNVKKLRARTQVATLDWLSPTKNGIALGLVIPMRPKGSLGSVSHLSVFFRFQSKLKEKPSFTFDILDFLVGLQGNPVSHELSRLWPYIW
ncbi:hypothetical protein NC651_026442 [Populus alba x Populus x berolinensis]|nr:hypothetical protein NC651_026442 [Populus alba x Populus x berolinensis]